MWCFIPKPTSSGIGSKCSWCLIHTEAVLSIWICYNFYRCFVRSSVWLLLLLYCCFFCLLLTISLQLQCQVANFNILNQDSTCLTWLLGKKKYSCLFKLSAFFLFWLLHLVPLDQTSPSMSWRKETACSGHWLYTFWSPVHSWEPTWAHEAM